MLNKFIKILTLLSLFFIFQGCGYQPLLSEKYKKFSVNNFNIEGDRKLGQSLANNFSKIENAEFISSITSAVLFNIHWSNKGNSTISIASFL